MKGDRQWAIGNRSKKEYVEMKDNRQSAAGDRLKKENFLSLPIAYSLV